MEEPAGWVASAATMIAAVMVAANLGSRVTGWGFVVFTVGSVSWSLVAVISGQNSLLLTNGFLTLVNIAGVWRWLGQQAHLEHGRNRAVQISREAPVATVFAVSSVLGSAVLGPDCKPIAKIADILLRADNGGISYVVLSQGGMVGFGEQLHAIPGKHLSFASDEVHCALDAQAVAALPELAPDNWPVTAPPTRPYSP